MKVHVHRTVVEEIQALWSRPLWALCTIAGSVVVGVVLGAMVVSDQNAVSDRARFLAEKGWGLIVVGSADGGSVDPLACTDAQVPGVLNVGMVGPSREVRVLGLGAGMGMREVSPSLIAVVWPATQSVEAAQALMTPGFVTLNGLDAGTLHVNISGTIVALEAERLSGPRRFPRLDGGVLLPRLDLRSVEYCLLSAAGEDVERVALEAASSTVAYNTIAVPVVARSDAAPTPADLVQAHQDRAIPLVAAAFLAVIAALRVLRSARDRAIYRLLGFGRSDLFVMGLIEYLVSIAVPASSAFVTVLMLGGSEGAATSELGAGDVTQFVWASSIVGLGFATSACAGRNRHQFAPGA